MCIYHKNRSGLNSVARCIINVMDDREHVIWKRIGQAIRARRRSLHVSVDKLAADVGVVRQQIVRLEAGLGGTTFPRLVAIAAALGISIEDLVSVVPSGEVRNGQHILGFRGHGLTPEEADKVLDYIEFLEHQRDK